MGTNCQFDLLPSGRAITGSTRSVTLDEVELGLYRTANRSTSGNPATINSRMNTNRGSSALNGNGVACLPHIERDGLGARASADPAALRHTASTTALRSSGLWLVRGNGSKYQKSKRKPPEALKLLALRFKPKRKRYEMFAVESKHVVKATELGLRTLYDGVRCLPALHRKLQPCRCSSGEVFQRAVANAASVRVVVHDPNRYGIPVDLYRVDDPFVDNCPVSNADNASPKVHVEPSEIHMLPFSVRCNTIVLRIDDRLQVAFLLVEHLAHKSPLVYRKTMITNGL
jgi:hypothetical protein